MKRALGPVAAFGRSLALFRRRPFALLSLGAALFMSLIAVCCGLGIAAAPWFLCELLAVLIGSVADETPRRSRAWISAGVIELGAVLIWSALAAFTLLELGPDLFVDGQPAPSALELRVLESAWWTLLAGALALALTVHIQYAPALLIERGGTLYGAVLESASWVAESGYLRSWATSIAAHALPLVTLTLVACMQLALSGSGGLFLSALLVLALPLLAAALSLGQGMLIAGYLALRDARPPIAALLPPSRSASALSLGLLVLLATGPSALLGSLLTPSQLERGELPSDAASLIDVAAPRRKRELYLADSALRLVVEPTRVQIVASDGGGAGVLPLPEPSGAISRVRVARERGARTPGEGVFAIQIVRGGTSYLTRIDENGVRLDDSFKLRSARLLPRAAVPLLLACWLWLVVWCARSLPAKARLAGAQDVRAYHRYMWRASLWLVPPALLSLWLALSLQR